MAKTRMGFVSNSSSSSFIIGYKDGVSLKDAIERFLESHQKEMIQMIGECECVEYSECSKNFEHIESNDEKVSLLKKTLLEQLENRFKYTKKLDNWNLFSEEISNDEETLWRMFLSIISDYRDDNIYIQSF